MTFDPWHFVDNDALPDTLVKRAKGRTVFMVGDDRWVVKGDSKLGDSKTHYHVSWDAETGQYDCTCYHSEHGQYRRKRMCSHVVAVVLGREDSPHPLKPERAEVAVEGEGWRDDPPIEPGPQLGLDLSGGTAIPLPSDDRWTKKWSEPLPQWLTGIGGHQWKAVEEIVGAFEAGAKIVWLDGPPGTGKTLIGELVRREMQRRTVYMCHSKSLQHQFVADYPYAKVLKGRSNYLPQLVGVGDGITCADCNKTKGDPESCEFCETTGVCPYEKAKAQALASPLAVVNTAYMLNEANYIGNISGRPLVIADECDTLEGEVMRFTELRVTPNMLNMLGIQPPQKGSHKTTVADWMMTEMVGRIREKIQGLRNYYDLQSVRRMQQMTRLLEDVKRVGEQVEDENWIRDNSGPLTFKPVKVSEEAPGLLWAHGEKWLCMSGTIISAEQLAGDLGVEGEQQAVVTVPMMYPRENRMIRVAPVANMVKSEKEVEWPKMVEAIKRVLQMHPGERVLVHTVSYDLMQYLADRLQGQGRVIVTYSEAADRDGAIARFRGNDGAVIIAPSLDRGVDFKGDDCRVVIVAKMPYPNLGDKQVSERMHTKGGQGWYNMVTVRGLVQSTQRAVRGMDDRCEIYILDRQFVGNVLKRSRGLLPGWWREAMDTQFDVRQLKGEVRT